MTTVFYTGDGWVPVAGASGPDPDPDPTAPPAVIILNAVSPSPTELRITWLAPTWTGGTVDHYQIDLDGVDYNWSLTATEITIGDLEPDTEYMVAVRAVSGDGLVGPSALISEWTQIQTPYDAELGVPGDRPALTERPGPTNTGPRSSTTQTMSGSQAIAAAQAAPVEADGYRYLRRARITGSMAFTNAATQSGLAFEDCYITSSGTYAVTTFNFGSPALPVKFQFCEIEGGSSATFYGGQARFLRCNMHRGTDILKPHRSNLEVYGCWLHDTWHGEGAHCDVVQIVTQSGGSILHWNYMHGFNAPESPSSAGGYSSGVLQTGSVTGPIGPVEWNDNWFDGAGYTIRCGSSSDRNGHDVDYTFRRNRFGRNYRYGPLYGMTDIDFDDSNVWDDTGLPVQD